MASEVLEYLHISLENKQQQLHMRWLRNVTIEEYRTGISEVKDLILHHKVGLWPKDSRLIQNILFTDQQWIKREIASLIRF